MNEIFGGDKIKYEKWFENLRATKWKVRGPVKGEDKVEKGVKLIWHAIRRKPYTRKKIEPVMDDWNCPEHGKEFVSMCKHCKALFDRFNRVNPISKGYLPIVPPDLADTLSLKGSGKLPIKRTHDRKEE